MAKIVAADVFKLRYDLGGYKLSYGSLTDIYPVLLKLTDDDGTVGWGEANPQQPFTEESADDVMEVLRDELLPLVLRDQSLDPWYIDGLLDPIRPEKHLLAKGAISIALLDIQGKRQGVPVADLLGKVLRRTIWVSHPTNNGTAAEDIAVIDAKTGRGIRRFHAEDGGAVLLDS